METSGKRLILWPLLLLAVLFAFFWRLDSLPLQVYDESRLANNALEAVQDGHWFVPHYRGKPDMWNTKPPTMIWLQGLSMKIFGTNELGVRFPAAFSAALCCLLLPFFGRRTKAGFYAGFLAAFILLSIPGFFGLHVARTGDYDALLCLFSALLIGFFYLFSQSENQRYLYYAALAAAGAVLTKSTAGLLFVPGLFFFLLYQRKALSFLRSASTWKAIGIFLTLVISYYAIRETVNPGYLKAVWENEWAGRYLDTLEGHSGGPLFYLEGWWNGRLGMWLSLSPLALLPLFQKENKLSVFLWIQLIFFMLIISSSGTKLRWYDAPGLILLAFLLGMGLMIVLEALVSGLSANGKLPRQAAVVVPFVLLILFFIPVFQDQYQYILDPPLHAKSEKRAQYGSFLKHHPDLGSIKIAYPDQNNAHVWFYARAGKVQHQAMTTGEIRPGDSVLICEEKAMEKIHMRQIQYRKLLGEGPCYLLEVEGL
ncbi:MAG: hypothetical protein GYB31_09685 [Bacteroidetes bacterium]|nr:hypothetical protein [Bacteroidota bacterium]